ncbi:MAG: phosphotransferase [Deltaproteobacteria bacterium]|nr:phosphotransferase [Deltaproteobacteria bacterium]
MSGRLASWLRNGIGVTGLLWIPTLFLLRTSLQPAPSAAALGAVLGLGMLIQGAFYAISNRAWFIGARPPLALVAAGAALALAGEVVALGLPLLLDPFRAVGPLEIRGTPLLLAAAQLFVLLFRAFTGRVAFRAMVEHADDVRERARAASRVLLPVGGFQLGRVVERFDDLAEAARERGDTAAADGLAAQARELRLRWDERFDRSVPWATAAVLVEAHLSQLSERSGGDIKVEGLARSEALDGVGVRCAAPCALLDALTMRLARGGRVKVESRAMDGALELVLLAEGAERSEAPAVAVPVLDELREMLRAGIDVAVERSGAGWRVSLRYPPSPTPLPIAELESGIGNVALELLEGDERPDKPKRVYRRGNQVVKVHRKGLHDPKPTLLEDEYFLMRRLGGQGGWFPEVTGTGCGPGHEWLSYRYEPGTPLDAWLADAANRTHWLRLLFDLHEMVRRLAELGVSHRDLNPGNVIVRPDGRPVLIDFDQTVADAPEWQGADLGGAGDDRAKNDLRALIERAGLTRRANDLVRCIARHTSGRCAPFELGVAGHRFPGTEPLANLWYPIRDELGPLAGLRILDTGSAAPWLGLLAASHGARVVVRPQDAGCRALVEELAPAIGGDLEIDPTPRGDFDVVASLAAGRSEGFDAPEGLTTGAAAIFLGPQGGLEALRALGEAGFPSVRPIAFTSGLVPLLLACRRVA